MNIREIMTPNPRVVGTGESIRNVARILADNQIGSVIVQDEDKRVQGLVTDRDITVGVVAQGREPDTTTVADLINGNKAITVSADDTVHSALETMKSHAVRRLPVMEGDKLVGIVSQADLAMNTERASVGDMVGAISAAPDNTAKM